MLNVIYWSCSIKLPATALKISHCYKVEQKRLAQQSLLPGILKMKMACCFRLIQYFADMDVNYS